MHVQPPCFSCILHDLNGAMEMLLLSPEQQWEIVRRAAQFMDREFRPGVEPSYFITQVHRILKDVSGLRVPFAELRAQCNRVGLAVSERVAAEVAGLPPEERFKRLIRWSIAGNHLDFRTVGTGYDFEVDAIASLLLKGMESGLFIDHTERIYRAVTASRQVLFIHDNVGEIALDKLLIREIRDCGPAVVSALRGGAITSDATLEDGEAVALAQAASRIICAGPDTLGISLREMTDELRSELETADLVMAKGQANYYVLSEYVKAYPRPVISLFSTKCHPVAGALGSAAKVNNIAMFLE